MNPSAIVVLLVVVSAVCASRPGGGQKVCYEDNEHFTNCGTECEPSCDLPGPRACILRCKLNTCECDKGFYRAKDNRCVLLEECHKYGKPHGPPSTKY